MDTDLDIRDAFNQRRVDCVLDHVDDPATRDECLRDADNEEYVGTEIYTTCTCTRTAEVEREEAVSICNNSELTASSDQQACRAEAWDHQKETKHACIDDCLDLCKSHRDKTIADCSSNEELSSADVRSCKQAAWAEFKIEKQICWDMLKD